ncbi:hypothetical protein K443DRAFT_678467, partial [Laccaria amethystina LaAM-08-1]
MENPSIALLPDRPALRTQYQSLADGTFRVERYRRLNNVVQKQEGKTGMRRHMWWRRWWEGKKEWRRQGTVALNICWLI